MTDEHEARLRDQMVETCRSMNSSGINQGTSGNLSARLRDGFLITPSALPYDQMVPEDLIYMDFDGSHHGHRRPSSEWRFHRDILANRPDANVVLHCHSIHATAVAVHHRTIPAFHYMVGVAGGTTINCAGYATFGTQELSDKALVALEGRMACLLGQHGQIALGTNLAHALWLAIEVETIAHMYLATLAMGEPPVLDDAEMANVIARMQRMSYGLSPDAEDANHAPAPVPAPRAKAPTPA
jgi:L-fuculose-phosphate aldolase